MRLCVSMDWVCHKHSVLTTCTTVYDTKNDNACINAAPFDKDIVLPSQ
jgi:hypothetical protein